MEHIKTLSLGFITIIILLFVSWVITKLPHIMNFVISAILLLSLSYIVGCSIRKKKHE
jgi:hypothetical protein